MAGTVDEAKSVSGGRRRRNGRGTNRRHPLLFLGTVAERGHAAWNTTLISALRRRWQPVGDEGLSSQILLSRYCNAFLPATAILCGRRSDRVRRRSDLAIPVPPGAFYGWGLVSGAGRSGSRRRELRACTYDQSQLPSIYDPPKRLSP